MCSRALLHASHASLGRIVRLVAAEVAVPTGCRTYIADRTGRGVILRLA